MTRQTENPTRGFNGTIALALDGATAAEAWATAIEYLADPDDESGLSEIGAQRFLDSRLGRHLADKVIDNIQRGATTEIAIEGAVEDMNCTRTGRAEWAATGVPVGTPIIPALMQTLASDPHWTA